MALTERLNQNMTKVVGVNPIFEIGEGVNLNRLFFFFLVGDFTISQRMNKNLKISDVP